MRAGLAVSVLLHCVLIAWGIVTLPSMHTLDPSQIESVPVDFIPIDKVTDLDKGVKTAALAEEKVREKPSEKVAETPPPPPPPPPAPEPQPPTPPAPEAKPEPPPPEPPQAEAKPPEPEPAPPPPAPPEPTPPPPAPAANPDPPPPEPPQAEAKPPEPEPAPPPPAPPEPTPPPPAPTPDPEPPPPPPPPPPADKAVEAPKPAPVPRPRPSRPTPKLAQAQTQQKSDVAPDEMAALIDKSAPTGSTNQTDEPATAGGRTPNPNAKMTADEMSALRDRMKSCWNPPQGATSHEELRTVVKVELNEDGSLAGVPQIVEAPSGTYARSAPESVVRAIRRCEPYTLPAEKYEEWREIEITFDPVDLFPG